MFFLFFFYAGRLIISGPDKTQGSSKWHLIRLSAQSTYVTLKFAVKRKMANCPQLWHEPSFGALAPPACPPLTPYGPPLPLPTLRARAQKPREVNDSGKSSDQPWLLETLGNRLENIKWLWINRGAALTLSFTKKTRGGVRSVLSCFAYSYLRISRFFLFFFYKMLSLFYYNVNNKQRLWAVTSLIRYHHCPPATYQALSCAKSMGPNIWRKKKKGGLKLC